jgi:SAM-dependent methyltransferase
LVASSLDCSTRGLVFPTPRVAFRESGLFLWVPPLLCVVPSVLSETDRSKLDTGSDDAFYDSPRFVTHADDGFVQRLTETYGSVLADGDRVFDAMSSWVSHLPSREYEHVVGHGLNEAELADNDALDEWFVQNFNRDQRLPLADEAFDAVLCALSVQYLQYPGEVFTEFNRVLAPDGVLVVSFTNRMFPTKAVRAWRTAGMEERAELVGTYCDAGGLSVTDVVSERPERDPFVAVTARPEPER